MQHTAQSRVLALTALAQIGQVIALLWAADGVSGLPGAAIALAV